MKNFVRKNILKFQPYIPGKPVEDVKRMYKLKDVIKLASNENPLGPSPVAAAAAAKTVRTANIYPDGNCFELRKRIARLYGVDAGQIVFGNGTDEIIELLGKTFLNPEDDIVVSAHAFIRYRMAGELMGCRVIEVPMKDYKHDLSAMADAVTKKTKIVFIANPNNPTGTYNAKQEFEKYFSRLSARKLEPLTFVDEAYAEYVDAPDYPLGIDLLKSGFNVVFSRTFSKIYGLAGLRVGYGIGRSDVISYIDRIRPPFNVSSVAQAAAAAAIEDSKHLDRSKKLVRLQKESLCRRLTGLGLKCVPSVANFILIDVKRDCKPVFEKLMSRGVIVRPMAEYGFRNFIRVTIGTASQNEKFIKELAKII
jgi:histidinol-phosphate aminotransferase